MQRADREQLFVRMGELLLIFLQHHPGSGAGSSDAILQEELAMVVLGYTANNTQSQANAAETTVHAYKHLA